MRAVTGKDSPWYQPCFKPLNEPYFTGDGNSGLRAGPQGESLSLAPYQLCLTQKDRVSPTQQHSRISGDNICIKDMQSLVPGL